MADLSERFAPYAPTTSVVGVLRRLRERGLSENLSVAELERAGVPPSMAPRTHQALRFLGLVNEDGGRTDRLEHLRKAGTAEYPDALKEVLRSAYKSVFDVVDPSQDDETALMDAFRHFEPAPQRIKMVRLFRGLAMEAGLEVASGRRGTTHGRAPTALVARRAKGRARVQTAAIVHKASPQALAVSAQPIQLAPPGAGYEVIKAIISQLPNDGRWTAQRRERWLQAITAAADLVVDVVEEKEVTTA